MELLPLSEPRHTLKMCIPKVKNVYDGLAFEECLYKAMYIYPKPINPNAQTIESHAKQIYSAELIERSICDVWPEYFKPLTFHTVQEYFGNSDDKDVMTNYDLLMNGVERTVTKNRKRRTDLGDWEEYNEVKKVIEYDYMFNDIFHVPSKKIIECKVYKNDTGRIKHINTIRNNRSRYKSVDYFLLAHDKSDIEFDITDLFEMTQQGYCHYYDLRDLVKL